MGACFHIQHLKSVQQLDDSVVLTFESPAGEKQICRIVNGSAPEETPVDFVGFCRGGQMMPDVPFAASFIETGQPLEIMAQAVWKGRIIEQMLGLSEHILQMPRLPVSTIDGITTIYRRWKDSDWGTRLRAHARGLFHICEHLLLNLLLSHDPLSSTVVYLRHLPWAILLIDQKYPKRHAAGARSLEGLASSWWGVREDDVTISSGCTSITEEIATSFRFAPLLASDETEVGRYGSLCRRGL